MPICTFFAFIFFLMRYQIEKYNFLFVYHHEYESVYLLNHIAKLQIFSLIFFQVVNFIQVGTLMNRGGEYELAYITTPFIIL